ncbi:MAG: 30S ribosomal protein S17 [Fibrobacteres bacterium]|nr:30S ribosomal protein S17 [Fibrobacterota bacterium]
MIERKNRKVRQGLVMKNAMQKTVVVKMEKHEKHTLYHRIVARSTKVMAHDENNECKIGDLVEIMETRPISKNKCWRVVKVLKKAD